MTVKELTDELSEFDPNLEIDFEFEEYSTDGGTCLLEPGVKFVFSKDDKETLIFNFISVGCY